jgi:hypothetical protein
VDRDSVGGYFTNAGGAPANHLAMWRAGGWTELGGGVSGSASVTPVVNALAVFQGALYVGGQFTSVGTLATNAIAKRQNGTWSRLTTLGVPLGAPNPVVQHLLPVNLPTTGGPALVAAGVFAASGGSGAVIIAAWSGSAWSALGVTSTSSYSNPSGLGVYDDGNGPALVASGQFNNSAGFIRWNGSSWDVIAPAMGDSYGGINTMTQTGLNAIFLGGSVTQIQNVAVPFAAMFSPSGVTPMSGFGHGFDGAVNALMVLDAGDGPHLYAGGAFRVADGQVCGGIARQVNGAWVPLATSVLSNNGLTGTIRALAAFDDQSGPALYAGGSFLSIDGVAALNIARWRPGSGWEAVGDGLNNFGSPTIVSGGVYALAIHNSSLYAAGAFNYTNTTAGLGHVARWSAPGWVPVGSGLGTSVDTPLALASFDPDGAGPSPAILWVGGKWGLLKRFDGSAWTTPAGTPTANSVSGLAVLNVAGASVLYAGGDFTVPYHTSVLQYTGEAWNPVGQNLTANGTLGTDIQPGAACFAAIDDGSGPALYAGGAFYDPTNYASYNIARLSGQQWTNIQGGLAGGSAPFLSSGVRALAADNQGSGPRLWAGGAFARYYFTAEDVVGAPSSNIAAVEVCRHCSADFNGDGDSGTDADIEAFFACLAGSCCQHCASADFNGDGDSGTDADIEAFFRVLAGSPC